MTTPVDPYDILDRDFGGEPEHPAPSSPTASSVIGKLLSWQARAVDWSVLEIMRFLFLHEPDGVPDVAEALAAGRETYGSRGALPPVDAFYPEIRPPADLRIELLERLDGGERLDIRYSSPYAPFNHSYAPTFQKWSANETCHVRLWRGHRTERPTVLCLHCWCGGRLDFEEHFFAASRLYEAGFDVAVVALPFHGTRAPDAAVMSGQFFPSYHLRRTNEAFGQAIADIRALVAWLRSIGRAQTFGVVGFSLGGYIASLLASIDPRVAFVVPMFAPASFADVLWWHGRGRPRWHEAISSGATLDRLRDVWAVHSPLSYRPKVPRERRLIVAGEGDAIVRPAQIRALSRHWNGSEVRWFSGGHIAHWERGAYIDEVVDWLRDAALEG